MRLVALSIIILGIVAKCFVSDQNVRYMNAFLIVVHGEVIFM